MRSINGNQYSYVASNYDTNYINPKPVEDLTNTTTIKTFDIIFKDMRRIGHTPRLNITDNQVVPSLKQYLEKEV